MMTMHTHQATPLTLCFVGPNNLLIIKKDDSAIVVNKQPVKYIKMLTTSSRQPVTTPVDGPMTPKFVAREFLLSPGEHSRHLMEYHCHKYWVVLSGEAWISVGKVTHMVTQQQSILIPPMQEHCIHNTTTEPLKFVEISASECLSGQEQIQFIDNPVYI